MVDFKAIANTFAGGDDVHPALAEIADMLKEKGRIMPRESVATLLKNVYTTYGAGRFIHNGVTFYVMDYHGLWGSVSDNDGIVFYEGLA